MENDEKVRQAFSDKTWNEIKTQDSWQIFKIMAEFVEGFEKLAKIGPCVSIFGSARENPETNIDAAIALLDEALQLAPNFRRATITKDALLAKKNTPATKE